jgi:dTDP-4-amino-4,6-dideoxygalactose transaminase
MSFEVPIYTPSAINIARVGGYLEIANRKRQFSNFGYLYCLLVERLADYFGVHKDQLVLVANATAALEAAVATHDCVAHWEIPSWSFAATGHAVSRGSHGNLSFRDVDLQTGVSNVSNSVGNKLAVLPFGMRLTAQISNSFDLIDAAASFGTSQNVGRELEDSTGLVISLHATKLLSAGEGGIFISKNLDWVARVRQYISFGFPIGLRESESSGTNAKFSEVAAAFCLSSFDDWPTTSQQLRERAVSVREISKNLGFEVIGATNTGEPSPYWVIRCDSQAMRDGLIRFLNSESIESRLWWGLGMHMMKAFSKVPASEPMTNTQALASTYLGLPFYPDLPLNQIERISHLLGEFLENRNWQ